MIRLSLPYPPSVNGLYANIPGKGRVKTERYKTWINAAGWNVKAARPVKVAGPYTLEITLFQSDKRKRDIDNIIKPISDLLVEHQLVEDDSLCQRLVVNRIPSDTQWAEVKVHSTDARIYDWKEVKVTMPVSFGKKESAA
jgi:crossover junction endodeoxyribonuclease RusA